MRRQQRALVAAAAALAASAVAAQDTAAPQRVEIIGTTPVPGTGVPRELIPSNVQTVGEGLLRRQQTLNVPEAMAVAVPGANVNEMQGNPYQMDVNYRGFAASPLLGTPQGLSVFLDGVRINEPFGDIVNWDLIPRAALAGITLLPGSNPLFGLNTLGGALTLETKSGDTHSGTEIELQGGSWGRWAGEFTHGRKWGEGGHLFVAASSLEEDGWRDGSPSRVRQLFAKAGGRGAGSGWELSLAQAWTRLVGNGPAPESMLAQRRAQVYTLPDITENRQTLVTFNGHAELGAGLQLAGTAYLRGNRTATLNGDLSDDYDPPLVPQSAVEHRTHTRQNAAGAIAQLSQTLGAHRWLAGASLDRSTSRFEQTSALGVFDQTRTVVAEEPAAVDARIAGHSRTASVFAQGLLGLATDLALSVSGRWNDTRVRTVDEGRRDLGLATELDADARYRRFNPALGLTWKAAPAATLFASVGEGNRTPSPIELGCSDPANPCVLPNALQSDPPLKQVVARTFEAGARGGASLRWNAAVFQTDNRDDLLFVSNGLASGYFTNFGRTRRRGLELGLSQSGGTLGWQLSYAWLRATYESSACIFAEGNSSAETSPACSGEGEIEIRPGDRLPGLPQHSLKLAADWRATPALTLGAQWRGFSGQYVRGNENNRHQPDGAAFNGSGRIGGYAVLDLTGNWRLGDHVELFAKLANVFDRRYGTAGLLGTNAFDGAGALQAPADWRNEQFVGPGAPRAAWAGLRLAFD